MSIISFNYIYNLLKEAARDVPDFYPDWVREHPLLERYETLSEITKEIPVEDYREPVVIDFNEMKISDTLIQSKIMDLLEDISTILIVENRSLKVFSEARALEDSEKADVAKDFITASNKIRSGLNVDFIFENLKETSKLSEAVVLNKDAVSNGFKVTTPKGVFDKRLKYDRGVNLVSICRMFFSDFVKYLDIKPTEKFEQLKDITQLASYKTLNYYASKLKKDEQEKSKSKDEFEIVFSKRPSDLLSMSIRADWSSCQNLLRDKNRNNVKAIYSTISPYVGVIYLTNKGNYKDKGEEMVARSLVFYLEHDSGDAPILFIGKVYSNYEKDYIKRLFANSLQRHSSLIVESTDNHFYDKYHFPFDKEDPSSFSREEIDEITDSGITRKRYKMPILPYIDETEDRLTYPFSVGRVDQRVKIDDLK